MIFKQFFTIYWLGQDENAVVIAIACSKLSNLNLKPDRAVVAAPNPIKDGCI
jgi:hypothetical protein